MHKKIKHILCLALTLPTVFAAACGGDVRMSVSTLENSDEIDEEMVLEMLSTSFVIRLMISPCWCESR